MPPFEVFEAVSTGAVPMGFDWIGYWADRIPVANLVGSMPFGPHPELFLAWMFRGGGLDIIQRAYDPHNVKVIPCHLVVAEAGGWFIASYYYFPGWHQPASWDSIIINMDVWNGLSQQHQRIFEEACHAHITFNRYDQIDAQMKAVDEIEAAGVEVRRFPDEVLAALREASREVMEETAQQDELFREAYESREITLLTLCASVAVTCATLLIDERGCEIARLCGATEVPTGFGH